MGKDYPLSLSPGSLLLAPEGGDFISVHVGFVVDYGSPCRVLSGLGQSM